MKLRSLLLGAVLALVAMPAFAQPGAPYAIAAAKDFNWQVVIGDTGSGRKFTPAGSPGGGVKIAGSITLPSGQSGRGVWLTPTFTTFTSGTTAEISGMLIDTPAITSSGAAITATANLKIAIPATAGSSNYSLWVQGAERHDGTQAFSQGTLTTSAPYTWAQTWNAGGVSFMGNQINITETADAAGSHYFDINGGAAGATSEFFVAKGGAVTAAGSYTGTVANLAAGTQTTSLPNTITQTWNAGGVTFNGLTETITETADAAASTYFNILGGAAGTTAEFSVGKGGTTSQLGAQTISATTNQQVLGTTNTTTVNYAAPAAGITLNMPNAGSAAIPYSVNCGSTGSGNQTCTNSSATAGTYHVISGHSTLSANAAVITWPTGLGFTSGTSYECIANDVTTRANVVQMVTTSGTQATITNTTGMTDVISWICFGN